MSAKGSFILIATALIGLIDVVWLVLANQEPRSRDAFQSLTGGVGLGSSLAPIWSFHSLNPRFEGYCENEHWPIPGLTCPNPVHGAGLVDLPALNPFAKTTDHSTRARRRHGS